MAYVYNPLYTHFKGNNISRSEWVQREVVKIILKSKRPDEDRSWSKTFELKHSSSVTQIARLLAQKRGLDVERAELISVMHDIYVFTTGRVTDHAHKGAPIAASLLRKTKQFSDAEVRNIARAIYHHSDKHIVSKDLYVELVKDADVFDCGLYEGVHDAYIYEKSPKMCRAYFGRIKRIRKELDLPKDQKWDTLEYVDKGKTFFAS